MSDMEQQVQKKTRLASQTIYEIISREGVEELSRPLSSLAWSGYAAGICICFSVLTMAHLHHYLPEDQAWTLLKKMGYVVGFLIVIMGRLQLFTENTITVILPLLDKWSGRNILRTLKLWGVVFATNMAGTMSVALMILYLQNPDPDYLEALTNISKHAVEHSFVDIFLAGIPAGFLIAVLVWMMPSAKGSEFLLITMMIFLISLGDYSHVVAGSFEAFFLLLSGESSLGETVSYITAAGLGNILGGTGVFTMLAYAQVKDEIR